MKTPGIKYADLLNLADQCRTRPGSEWIDAAKLAAMLTDGEHATNIKATAPDNIADAIEMAKRMIEKHGEIVVFKGDVAAYFGVTSKTLRNWEQCYNYKIIPRYYSDENKWLGGKHYYIPDIIKYLEGAIFKKKFR